MSVVLPPPQRRQPAPASHSTAHSDVLADPPIIGRPAPEPWHTPADPQVGDADGETSDSGQGPADRSAGTKRSDDASPADGANFAEGPAPVEFAAPDQQTVELPIDDLRVGACGGRIAPEVSRQLTGEMSGFDEEGEASDGDDERDILEGDEDELDDFDEIDEDDFDDDFDDDFEEELEDEYEIEIEDEISAEFGLGPDRDDEEEELDDLESLADDLDDLDDDDDLKD